MQTLGNGLVLLHVINLWEYNRVSDWNVLFFLLRLNGAIRKWLY
jgi:hypothetical protein